MKNWLKKHWKSGMKTHKWVIVMHQRINEYQCVAKRLGLGLLAAGMLLQVWYAFVYAPQYLAQTTSIAVIVLFLLFIKSAGEHVKG